MLAAKQHVVIILGMHRSGTSCLTGSLQQAGLFLGDVNEAATYNARGNRERRAIMDLHDALLQFNGGNWDRPPLTTTWTQAHREQQNALVRSYPCDRTWGFKDPRTLWFLDGWIDALPNARMVGTYRHPAAVCESLRRRNRFSREKSLDLWLAYNQRLLHYQRQYGFQLVCFDWEPQRYEFALQSISKSLDLPEVTPVFTFFDAALRVNRAFESDLPLPKRVSDVLKQLHKAAG